MIFEIINGNEVYISRCITKSKFIKIPESVEIDGKKIYCNRNKGKMLFKWIGSSDYLDIFFI
ncbi:MAG: hypothetical protein L6U99_06395 [Clostridium sp.]|nr:MAG: hypothetical protein L6U99_06395 [Clostridium sp.]